MTAESHHSPVEQSRGRDRALDGLRGIAALGVLLFHVDVPGARSGILGVDVFFALSGFLIMRLLLRARLDAAGTARFWARRVVRLWPPLVAVVAVGMLFAREFSPDGTVIAYVHDAVSAASWTMDAVISADPSTSHLLGFTWTLAIEEQFYIALPILLIIAQMAALPRRGLVALLSAAAFASWLVLVLEWKGSAQLPNVYTRPDARAFPLLMGCVLGLVIEHRLRPDACPPSHRAVQGKAWIGATVFVACAIVPGALGWSLRPVLTIASPAIALGTCLLIDAAVSGEHAVTRVLSARPFVTAGLISYSLYLVQQPVLRALYDHGSLPTHPVTGRLLQIGVALAAAGLLWWCVERPVRHFLDADMRIHRAPQVLRRVRRGAALGVAGAIPLALVSGGVALAIRWRPSSVVTPANPAAPSSTSPGAAEETPSAMPADPSVTPLGSSTMPATVTGPAAVDRSATSTKPSSASEPAPTPLLTSPVPTVVTPLIPSVTAPTPLPSVRIVLPPVPIPPLPTSTLAHLPSPTR